MRLTSRILSRSLRPTNGWSFSAISWAASRGWSFCGRRGKSTIWLIGTKPRMPQSTMRPPLLWSMTGASMIDARLELLLHRAPLALEAGAAEREDRVALGRLRLEDVDEDGVADVELRAATRRGGRRARGC